MVCFDAFEDEDGLHDCRGAAGATAELRKDFPGLEDRNGAFAEGSDASVGAVDLLLRPRQPWPVPVAFERGADGAASPLVSLVGERLHVAAGQCVDQANGPGGGQVVCSSGRAGEAQTRRPAGSATTWTFMPWRLCLPE